MAELKDFEIMKQVDLSEYARKLSSCDLAVYMEKLTLESGEILPDPYNIGKHFWINDVKLWPNVTYPDIYNYFVTSASYYSNEEIKCYKSIDSYQYFVCGHVQQVMFYNPNMGDLVYLLAKVLPSQRQGVKTEMYSTYLVVHNGGDKDGQIHTAHCTCMAGRGKACSHAAAVAYKVDAAIRSGMKESASTSSLCKWNDMSRKKAQPAKITDINFKKPRYGEDVRGNTAQGNVNRTLPDMAPLDFINVRGFEPKAVIFSCIDVKTDPELPCTINEVVMSMIKNNVSQEEMFSKLGDSFTDQNLISLEELTQKQSQTNVWHKHRIARITASKMHRFLTLKESTDRTNAVKEILEPRPFTSDGTAYGIANEEKARKTYAKFQRALHGESFVCNTSGLVLNKKFPHLGASPDGIVECACCGKGCLEIKCMQTYESGLPDPRSDTAKTDSRFPVTHKFSLKQSHKFYTQVQGHMLICELDFCDFYLWSKSNSLTVRVWKDDAFIGRLLTKMRNEYTQYILPEIIARIKA